MEHLEAGRKILADHYGGVTSSSYIDFYLRKIELYINLVIEAQ